MSESQGTSPKPEILLEPPLVPDSELGPYRRHDYEQLPDLTRAELIRGKLYASPSLTPSHQLATALLRERLAPVTEKIPDPVRLAFYRPVPVRLADHSVVLPDIVYLSAARLELVKDWIEGVPDLLAEVLSAETGRCDRVEKLMLYAECGVPEYWIVDIELQVIDCLVNEGGRYVLSPPTDGRYRSLRLPEIQIDILEFWQELQRQRQKSAGWEASWRTSIGWVIDRQAAASA